jgi:hypothetical protein
MALATCGAVCPRIKVNVSRSVEIDSIMDICMKCYFNGSFVPTDGFCEFLNAVTLLQRNEGADNIRPPLVSSAPDQ